jgi:hypothetical protein
MVLRRVAFLGFVQVLSMTHVATAHGGNLVPKKASDIVQLNTTSGAACGAINKGLLFVNRAEDSGSGVGISSFTMPLGRVLVVTRAEIVVQSATPGSFTQIRFFNSGGAGGGTEYGLFSTTVDAAGTAHVAFDFPTGVIVRSIENLCGDLSFGDGALLGGVLHGLPGARQIAAIADLPGERHASVGDRSRRDSRARP